MRLFKKKPARGVLIYEFKVNGVSYNPHAIVVVFNDLNEFLKYVNFRLTECDMFITPDGSRFVFWEEVVLICQKTL